MNSVCIRVSHIVGHFSATVNPLVRSRAVNLHSFFADPDPAVLLNADPDPAA